MVALAASDTVATLLPAPAIVLRDHLPPARALLDAGATVALASDANAGTYSGFGTMPLVIGLAATLLGMTVTEALAASTAGGATALRRPELGALRVGASRRPRGLGRRARGRLRAAPRLGAAGADLDRGRGDRSLGAARLSFASMDRFDIVIIGAGAAGEAAAHYARSRDASVAIIDRGLFGGSCPFWACMPSKALLHAAAVHHAGGDYPWAKASDFRDYMINREGTDTPDDSGHVRSLEGAGATVIRGSAALAGPQQVRIGDRLLQADAVILAVGSVSRVPHDLPGLAEAQPVDERRGHLHPRAAEVAGDPRRRPDRRRAGAGLRAVSACPSRSSIRATASTTRSIGGRPSFSATRSKPTACACDLGRAPFACGPAPRRWRPRHRARPR